MSLLQRFATGVLENHAAPPRPSRERRRLWTAQILSAAAQAGALVVALTWVMASGVDSRGVGLVLAAGLLSLAALTRPAAILADRVSRRAMMIVPHMILAALLPVLGVSGLSGEWRAAFLSVAVGAARALFDAAGSAIVHHHTDDGRTGGALADLSRRHTLGHLLGVAGALPLAVLEGPVVAGIATAALWAACAAILLPLHPVLDGPSQPRPSLASLMSHGVAELLSDPKPRLAAIADLAACGVGGAVGALAFPELVSTIGPARAALAVSAGVLFLFIIRPVLSRVARARVAPVMAGGLLTLAVASLALALADRAAEGAAAYGILLAGAAVCAAAGSRSRSRLRAELRAPTGLANGALAAAVAGAGAGFGGLAGTTVGVAGALLVTAIAAAVGAFVVVVVALRPLAARLVSS
jgi:Transmembrane secretion effector